MMTHRPAPEPSDRITTTVSRNFSVAAAFLDTNADPDGTVVSLPLTGNVFCTPVAPVPVLTVTCSNAAPERRLDR